MDTLERYILSSYHLAPLDYYIHIDGIFILTHGENSRSDIINNLTFSTALSNSKSNITRTSLPFLYILEYQKITTSPQHYTPNTLVGIAT